MLIMNKRQTGSDYEAKAVEYLQDKGVRILEQNYRNRKGEIDIIARDGEYLIFVEVKYRRDIQKGAPEEAVTYAKQRNICRVADFYRMTHGIGEFIPIRYDVIACCGNDIVWYQNAFSHIW